MVRRLWAWLRRKFTRPNLIVEAFICGKGGETVLRRFRAVGTIGLHLQAIDMENGGVRLLASNQVLDQDQFWDLWKRWNEGVKVTWEDGTKVRL
jgi:hypothetical protein